MADDGAILSQCLRLGGNVATPESKVKAKVKEILTERKVYHFFPATGGYGRSGVPDVVACVGGIFMAIECKAKGNTATPLQQREMENIRSSGGMALLINETNLDILRRALDNLLYDRSHT